MLGRNVGDLMNIKGVNYPFDEVKSSLNGDITFGNLENPATDEKTQFLVKDYPFKAKPSSISGLSYAGFDIVSIANNHIMDYGPQGAQDTVDNLEGQDMLSVGLWHGQNADTDRITRPVIIELEGMKVGYLAYTDGVPPSCTATNTSIGPLPMDMAIIEADITYSAPLVDILVVSIHWVYQPQYNTTEAVWQKNIAHNIIDFGADIIVGTGPHVLQGIEGYNNGLIMYSLGNFVFDIKEGTTYLNNYPQLQYSSVNEMNTEIFKSMIVKVRVTPSSVDSLRLTPIFRYDSANTDLDMIKYQPRFIGHQKGVLVSNEMYLSSQSLAPLFEDASVKEVDEPGWHIYLSILVFIVSIAVNAFIFYMVLFHKYKKGGIFKRMMGE